MDLEVTKLNFEVPGVPAPGGSKTAGRSNDGRLFVRDSGGMKTSEWKQRVAIAAADAMKDADILNLMQGPVKLTVQFLMPRPKSHYRTGRNAHLLKKTAPKYHTTKPDTLKLMRSTEDALTGVVWMDDSQVIEQTLRKNYTEEVPMAIIAVMATSQVFGPDNA